MRRPGLIRTVLLTMVFGGFLWLSWTGALDQLADKHLQPAFKKAFLTLAAARGLNSVISVAQGTELALQPAGVGVTLSVGEILDPLNDLVERFSWLVLMAVASLGIQITLMEIFSNPVVNLLFTIIVTGCVACVWLCRTRLSWFSQNSRFSAYATRLASVFMLTRFALAIVTLVTALLSQFFLENKLDTSIQAIQQTSGQVEEAVENSADEVTRKIKNDSLLDIFSAFLQEQKQALDMQTRIAQVQNRVESAISHIINLIVLYLLQTLIIPLTVLYFFHKIVKSTWQLLSFGASQQA